MGSGLLSHPDSPKIITMTAIMARVTLRTGTLASNMSPT
ncbi:hypothetical protein BLSMQ_2657 [Brevibacterium aurantiacum]|uniref:Uncharacterized protein n=1 Tax=Brevibacterium aurantiacum TaxID=273384 RepID=A0A1D7W5P0_BREAU|nr:hypothetical protein BLSMQ_2657 [Brevibacterium aurantiacum]